MLLTTQMQNSKVNYDKHELVSFDKKTIFGTRAQMDLGKPNSLLGLLHYILINRSLMKKLKLGMNPRVILFGMLMDDMNGKWTV